MHYKVTGEMLKQNDENYVRSTEQEIDQNEERKDEDFLKNEHTFSIEYIESND